MKVRFLLLVCAAVVAILVIGPLGKVVSAGKGQERVILRHYAQNGVEGDATFEKCMPRPGAENHVRKHDNPQDEILGPCVEPTSTLVPPTSQTPTKVPPTNTPRVTPVLTNVVIVTPVPGECVVCTFWKEFHQYVVGTTFVVELLNSNNVTMTMKVEVVITDNAGKEYEVSGTTTVAPGQIARVQLTMPCEHGILHASITANPFHGGQFILEEDFSY